MDPRETTVLLIRHGHTEAIGRRLVGRSPGVHLTEAGRAQAVRLRDRLLSVPLARIYASPLVRAIETATPLAEARGLEVEIIEEVVEVDFGAWTGLTFDELSRLPEWERFNTHRAVAEVPGGERGLDVQARTVAALDRLRARHPGETIAVVSHADVIRAAVLLYVGASLDMVPRLEISPASITAVALGTGTSRLLYVNHRDLGA